MLNESRMRIKALYKDAQASEIYNNGISQLSNYPSKSTKGA
jgi:hypothetical protein